ncbi:protein RKD1-like [Actinidia eriantha]|uniref:protein RKD1-like n=1 Tax=Actinidia eriantha TaxID=165200 RepID=UPI0025840A57|nr:protein RKD1-like [Actinidia eriantha]
MAKQEEYQEAFTFPILPLDFSGYSALDYEYDLSEQESTVFDALLLCSPMDLVPTPNAIQEEFLHGYGDGFGVCNDHEMSSTRFGFDPQSQPLLLCNNESSTHEEYVVGEKKVKSCTNSSKMIVLSRNTISQYFYMPITQAAKELHVGLTLLKKRCRELGIRRWPHRKLMSLQTLIKNVQEMGKEEGDGDEGRCREAIEILEQERKLMEEAPDTQLHHQTKRLRQECFKANYKKRKLMGMNMVMVESHDSSSTSTNLANSDAVDQDYDHRVDDDDGDEGKEMSSDCFYSNVIF